MLPRRFGFAHACPQINCVQRRAPYTLYRGSGAIAFDLAPHGLTGSGSARGRDEESVEGE
eukprot:3071428-Rhodomonas_salina.2